MVVQIDLALLNAQRDYNMNNKQKKSFVDVKCRSW